MTGVVSLTVGAVTVGTGANAASVTGSPPQWSDASDATYATTSTDNVVGGTYLVAPVTGDATGLSALTLTIRQEFASGNTGYGARFSNVHFYIGGTDIGAVSPANVNLGTIEDVTVDVTPSVFDTPYTLSDWAAACVAGTASVRVLPGSPTAVGPTNTVTVYELALSAAVLSPCFQTLDPTAVQTFTGSTTYGDVWTDGSDSTSIPLTVPGLTDATGALPAYDGPSITDITVNIRASATGTTPIPIMVEIDEPDPGSPSGRKSLMWVAGGSVEGEAAQTYGMPLDLLISNDGVVRDYSVTARFGPDTFDRWTAPDDLRPSLSAGGCSLYLWPDPGTGTGSGTVTVYEAAVRIGHKCYVLNPLRRWPGGAATGPTNIYPRRLTRRPGTF